MFLYDNLVVYHSLTKGKGIITMKPIKKGTFIMWYEGKFISNSDLSTYDIGGKYDYEAVNGFVVVDQPFHKSHYINDCLTDNNFEKSKNGLNVICISQMRLMKNMYWPCFIAARDIEPGEPLETHYGSSYWTYHEPKLFCENLLCQIHKYSLLRTMELLDI